MRKDELTRSVGNDLRHILPINGSEREREREYILSNSDNLNVIRTIDIRKSQTDLDDRLIEILSIKGTSDITPYNANRKEDFLPLPLPTHCLRYQL